MHPSHRATVPVEELKRSWQTDILNPTGFKSVPHAHRSYHHHLRKHYQDLEKQTHQAKQ